MKRGIKLVTILAIVTVLFISSVSVSLADPPPWDRWGSHNVYESGTEVKCWHTAFSEEDEDWICVLGNLRMNDGGGWQVVDSDVDDAINDNSVSITTSDTNPAGIQEWFGRSAFIFVTTGYDAQQIDEDTFHRWY